MTKLLIADDNKDITKILVDYSRKEGYEAIVAHDGEEALELFFDENPQIVLLDVMMPRLDGFSVLKKIRKKSTVPVLLITARGEDYERILGLDQGADDYIVKPFSPPEVMARIRAILRRIEEQNNVDNIILKDLEIIPEMNLAIIDDEEIKLSKKEADILYLLASNPQRVYTREIILEKIWGYDYYGDLRTVDTNIKRLRQKLHTPHSHWDIVTIRGRGYTFEIYDE